MIGGFVMGFLAGAVVVLVLAVIIFGGPGPIDTWTAEDWRRFTITANDNYKRKLKEEEQLLERMQQERRGRRERKAESKAAKKRS